MTETLELENAETSLSLADMKTVIQLYRAKRHAASLVHYATTIFGGGNKQNVWHVCFY